MRNIVLLLAITGGILFQGCSSKEVYTPENLKGEWRSSGSIDSSIVRVTQSAALLDNGAILMKNGKQGVKIPEDFRFINLSGEWVIVQNSVGDVHFIPQNGIGEHIVLELKKTVAAISVQGDTVAIVFGNNEMALYSLESKKMTFKENSNAAITVDDRIVNPYFLKDLVVFSTLDGKIVIVNETTKQLVRSIIVGSEEYFSNITYLNVIDNNMIASTGSSVLSLSQKEVREKYDVRDIVANLDGIWLTTKQGEVVALGTNLQYKAKKKFPFAHFVGLNVQNDRVYAIERGGYLIALSKDLLDVDVYDIDMKNDTVFVSDKKIYFNDQYIEIK